MFNERVREYRNQLKLNMRQMADKIGVSEQLYSMIERGYRNRKPSKEFLKKLVSFSGMSEEYWLYGISNQEYINNKDSFKNLRKILETILELGVIKNADDLFNNINCNDNSIEKLLIEALRRDINNFINK